MSLHAQQSPPTRISRIAYYVGPFALLSVFTSVAFNRAILARERDEQRRLHELQMSLLRQLHAEASSNMSSSSSYSLLSSLQEQRKLARRMRALQLDPLRLGFSRQVLPSLEEEEKLQKARAANTSWATALFGSGLAFKLRDSIGRTKEAIRERGFGMGPIQAATSEEDEEDAAWVQALEESLESSENESSINKNRETRKADVELPSLREEDDIPIVDAPKVPEYSAPSNQKRRIYA